MGYSDITGLHWFLHAAAGLQTFYGPSVIAELGTADSIDDESSPLTFCVRSLFDAIVKPEPLGSLPRSQVYAPKFPSYFLHNTESVEVQHVVEAPKWQWLRSGKAQGRLFDRIGVAGSYF